MVRVRLAVYFYKRSDTFYFSRSIPSDLQHRFKKRKIEVSLRTKSEAKAAKSAAALSFRIGRYWDSLRMEVIHSRELDLSVAPETKKLASGDFGLSDAASLYQRLTGASAAINKWLKPRTPDGCVAHSFRYSIRVRLNTTVRT